MDPSAVLISLQNSFQGNQQQVLDAQNFLSSCMEDKPSFSSILFQILSDTATPATIKFAASIQLKYVLSDESILRKLSFEFLITIIIRCPQLAQIQLQKVLVNYLNLFLHDDGQFIQLLLSFLTACFKDNEFPHSLGFQVIRSILKCQKRHFQGYSKADLVNEYIFPLISQSSNIQLNDFYILHHCLLTLNHLLNYTDMQPLDNWANLIISILSQDIDFSIQNSTIPFKIDKDCIKFATGIIELKPMLFNPQQAAQIFVIIVNKIQNNQLSYEAVLFSLHRYIPQFLNFDRFVSQFNHTNFMFEFVTNILYQFFVLTPALVQQINEDLFSFLFSRHNSQSQDDTPVNCSISILQKLFNKNYLLDEVSQFSLQRISDSENQDLFGNVHFASIVAPFLNPAFTQTILQIIQMKISSDTSNLLHASSLFLFTSRVAIPSIDLFSICLSNLTKSDFPPIIHYFSAVSLPNFYSVFPDNADILPKILQSIDISQIFTKLLELNSRFPTCQMSISTEESFNYFIECMVPISVPMSESLFSLYYQFLHSDDQHAKDISSSLIQLCELMQNQMPQKVEFFNHFWQLNIQLLSEINPEYLDQVLSLLHGSLSSFFSTSIDLQSTPLLPILIGIPNILNQLYQKNKQTLTLSTIVEIITIISGNLHQLINPLNVLSDPIAEILLNALSSFSPEEEFGNLLISPINKLTEVIFLVLNEEKYFSNFLEIFTQINQPFFADSIAALATMNPIITFSNDLNFRIVVNSSSPAVFLLCMQKVFGNFGEMPANVVLSVDMLREEIVKRCADLSKIISMVQKTDDDDDDLDLLDQLGMEDFEDPGIFNFEELLLFWKEFTF